MEQIEKLLEQDLEIDKEKRDIINYKKGSLLGEGSYGKVYQGFDEDVGNIIAIKEIDIKFTNNNNYLESKILSFQQEIDILSKLNHKNIIKYFGTNRTHQTFHIFLEFCIGGSIAKMLQDYNAFSENIIRKYTKQILEGLQYLHAHNIIHRDIKGANILVDNNGLCKLSDFGGSKIIADEIEFNQQNSFKGTPNWMAPETVRHMEYTRFSDIWSLGCTIIEMATGQPPWSEYKNPMATLYNLMQIDKSPQFPSHLSENCKHFLSCCLKINPKERLNVCKLLKHPFIQGEKVLNYDSLNSQQNFKRQTKSREKNNQDQIINNFEDSKSYNYQESQNMSNIHKPDLVKVNKNTQFKHMNSNGTNDLERNKNNLDFSLRKNLNVEYNYNQKNNSLVEGQDNDDILNISRKDINNKNIIIDLSKNYEKSDNEGNINNDLKNFETNDSKKDLQYISKKKLLKLRKNSNNPLKNMIENIKNSKKFDSDSDNNNNIQFDHKSINLHVESSKNVYESDQNKDNKEEVNKNSEQSNNGNTNNQASTDNNNYNSSKSENEKNNNIATRKPMKRKIVSDIEINNNKENYYSKNYKLLKEGLTGSNLSKGKKFTFNEITEKSKIDKFENTPTHSPIIKINTNGSTNIEKNFEVNFANINMKVFSNSNDLNENLQNMWKNNQENNENLNNKSNFDHNLKSDFYESYNNFNENEIPNNKANSDGSSFKKFFNQNNLKPQKENKNAFDENVSNLEHILKDELIPARKSENYDSLNSYINILETNRVAENNNPDLESKLINKRIMNEKHHIKIKLNKKKNVLKSKKDSIEN